jgi:hypothetical protein
MVMSVGVTPGVAGHTTAVGFGVAFGAGVGAAMALLAMTLSSTEALAPVARAAERRVLLEKLNMNPPICPQTICLGTNSIYSAIKGFNEFLWGKNAESL